MQAARRKADAVVVMIHGGEEYKAHQTALVRDLSATAISAGSAIVVNGHPHVVGGITTAGGALLAESMGNLLFDQTVWPTFLSYLLRADVRAGRAVVTSVDPVLLDDYVPRPTVGSVADASSRRAAGLLPGPTQLRPPGAVLLPAPSDRTSQLTHVSAGTVARLSPGWWVEKVGRDERGRIAGQVGEDLLWSTGSFEDMDVDPTTDGGHLWALSDNGHVSTAAACSGAVGAELVRSPLSAQDVVLTPKHRQLVSAGMVLSLIAEVRGASSGATMELRWYPDTNGPSDASVTVRIPEGSHARDECQQMRLDATVPENVVAAQPFLRLVAPEGVHRSARLAVDNIRLVGWARTGDTSRRYDTLEARRSATWRLSSDATEDGKATKPFSYLR